MRSKYWLNCILVAVYIWISLRGKCWIAVKRSASFNGCIPHMCVWIQTATGVMSIDYEPVERKQSVWGNGDWFPLFRGVYRVEYFEMTSMVKSGSYADTIKFIKAD